MSRIARVVNAGFPHHVIQRGNRRQNVFFNQSDKEEYLSLLKGQSEKHGLTIWAYCLMDNHVHLIVVPEAGESLAKAIGETHRLYTRMINFREKWRGYLWQGRFSSFPLDKNHLYWAVRYVERNPVRAGMVEKADEYRWSSARVHVKKKIDPLLSQFYLLDEIHDWRRYLAEEDREEQLKMFRKHIETGRPLGDDTFIEMLERKLGIILKKQKPGPKSRN